MKKAWYIAIYFFFLLFIQFAHRHIARDLMQVTGYAKVWFPFHLIRSCFICLATLLMSISRPNWFWRCAYTRFVLYYVSTSRIKYRILYIERSRNFCYTIYFIVLENQTRWCTWCKSNQYFNYVRKCDIFSLLNITKIST